MVMTRVPISAGFNKLTEMSKWLTENIGPSYNYGTQEMIWQYGEFYEFVEFKYKKDATAFALKWS